MYGKLDPGVVGHRYPEFIQSMIKALGCETFLELGVAHGGLALSIYPLVKRYVGVDIRDSRTVEKVGEFYLTSTDEFFKFFHDEMQIILIDACHDFEVVKRDLNNSLNILAKNGVIFIHDTDPWEPKFFQDWLCSDAYKIVNYIQTERTDLNIITLPMDESGISVVNRKSDRRVLSF